MKSVRDATYQLLRELGLTTVFGNVGSTEEIFLKTLPSAFRRYHHSFELMQADARRLTAMRGGV